VSTHLMGEFLKRMEFLDRVQTILENSPIRCVLTLSHSMMWGSSPFEKWGIDFMT